MKTARLSCSLSFLCLLLAGSAHAATKADVPPTAARKKVVDLAAQIAQPAATIAIQPTLKSPFHPDSFKQPDPEDARGKGAAQPGQAKVLTEKDILLAISEKVNPSGTATLGGEQVLLIRQKKIKKGDRLSISFDGQDYEVEITDIQRTTFSLRLNRTEISRPIKSGK